MVYIKQLQKIARIGRHKISQIQKTDVLTLYHGIKQKDEEECYKLLLGYDLSECFYLSCTYDLTNSLNQNVLKNAKNLNKKNEGGLYRLFSSQKNIENFAEIFMWNYYACSEFNKTIQDKKWIQPILHGYIEQIVIKTTYKQFSTTIISRRCRHHAGTRFLKRGMNEEGFSANFVETEQILIDLESSYKKPSCSSFIQVRGSVPLYWFQNPLFTKIKPPIICFIYLYIINKKIKISKQLRSFFCCHKKNFGDLFSRYGEKIYCMDLVKSFETSTKNNYWQKNTN
ncbi:polyphosphoinositide phosphatase, putative, partial [Ichthyophthirius multifiliis]